MLDLLDKVLGAYYGIGIGDAMGMPTEFSTREAIKKKYGTIKSFLDAPDDHPLGYYLPAGSFTDDTINSLIVSRLLIENNAYIDSHAYVNMLNEWLSKDETNNMLVGPSTKKALKSIKDGVSIKESGRDGTTNGAAMKIIPIGLVCDYNDIENLVNQVYAVCLPTHNTKTAVSAACAIAAAASYSIRISSSKFCMDDLFRIAYEAALYGARKGFDSVSLSVAKKIYLARNIVDSADSETAAIDELYDIIGTGLASSESIPAAFGILYLAGGKATLSAQYGASIGGDTDTIGSMATGICGAIGGASQFPQEWVHLIKKANQYNLSDISRSIYTLIVNQDKNSN